MKTILITNIILVSSGYKNIFKFFDKIFLDNFNKNIYIFKTFM